MSGVVAVGIDGSDRALDALRWAAEEARIRGARLRIVHAWSFLDQGEDHFDPKYGEADARRVIDDAVAALGAAAEGLDIEPLPVCDLPARGLLDGAHDADLIVVGARGLGAVKGLVLGSVSGHVVHHAKIPVVVVPHS